MHACVHVGMHVSVSRKKDMKRGHAHAKGVDSYGAASGRDTSYAHNRLDKVLFDSKCTSLRPARRAGTIANATIFCFARDLDFFGGSE